MNQPSMSIKYCNYEPENCFWESEEYSKSYFETKKNKYIKYHDSSGILKYLFFYWVNKWALVLSKKYLEPYKLHPLPVSDQILVWEPVFSKHISDGIIRLESYEQDKARSKDKLKRPYKSILFHALLMTFWKKFLVLTFGLICTNVMTMSIAILVKSLLGLLNDKSISFTRTFFLLLVIILFQVLDGLIMENISFYMYRIIATIHGLFMISVFRHGMCHRRKFANNIEGINSLNVCNEVLHSCSPDSECSKNPLFCQALRYQNKDVNPQMFNFVFNDSYYISMSLEPIKFIIEFVANFIYGIFLISVQMKVNIWVLYVVGVLFVVLIVTVEIVNTILLKFMLHLRDCRISKSNHIIMGLSLVKKVMYDDIATNIITKSRNKELSILFIRISMLFFNLVLYSFCINTSFYIIKHHFVELVRKASVVTDIDTTAFMTTFYIFLRIVTSMFLIPSSVKAIGVAYISFKRADECFRDSSPNFYISDNKYTGSVKTSTNIVPITTQLPKDVVVYYKDATFTWVNTRNDLLNKNYDTYLKNINFELKRGEMVIVTGSQGSGKSNFIKSMLGEMTLVGGSMAIVPLHTSMPIFYASQDIWLQHGTIRSNITFGYKFDEHLYNTVLKAVELEFDISTWDKGDLRVVSDNAHSLSGGQRVRMELARAVYAYMVFHQVNKEYNNSQCSFLMCLDASFHGLDPYVSKTIFNNLFNVKTGLLVKNDLSVVLTSSKQGLQTCLNPSDANQFHNLPIFNVKNKELKFCSNLHDFMKNNKVESEDYKYISTSDGVPYNMSYISNDKLALCSSDDNTREGRTEVTKAIYSKLFNLRSTNQLSDVTLSTYFVFMKPALVTFMIFIVLNVVATILDSVKLVLSTNLSEYITKRINQYKQGELVNLYEIKSRANISYQIVYILIIIIIVTSTISIAMFSISCIKSSRKLHEYVLDSIFKNSAAIIKVKRQISQIITYLSCDTTMIDDGIGMFLSLVLIHLIQMLIHLVTLIWLVPVSLPAVFITLLIIYIFVLKRYVDSSKSIHLVYLESSSRINAGCENAISGSSIYRSFKMESELMTKIIEHSEYKSRTRFMYRSVLTWSAVSFNWIFSVTTLLILIIPILLDRCTDYDMNVGYFGLSLSLCMSITKSYSKFSSNFSLLEMFMCSIRRFECFIPPGDKLKFKKCHNTHEEHVANPVSINLTNEDKTRLLRRRSIEFKDENKKFYALRRLFYHPKLHIMDVNDYLNPDRTGVQLKDVCVYTTPQHNPESMILKHITVPAGKSEIIGIVGRTGAGKTTLLSVLQNISTNRTGQVLLDGKDLNDIPKVVLRQIIGVLPQLPFVFKGWTIRRFLDPRKLFSDDEINQALSKCGLLNFVNELPGSKKLDSVILQDEVASNNAKQNLSNLQVNKSYEKTVNTEYNKHGYVSDMLLSNTQLRTLSLARLVLYKHFFRLIVVDEPPEEDPETASIRKNDLSVPIYDILQKHFSHCTTFVTAHDVNVLKSCTSVWVIHEGCVVKTCKASDVSANESIAAIIEESVKYSK
ncbi:ABC transporter [Theileria orientalis strain Shintoku]|uniref:ABC transporter n=1 Tax=Theileria orientalis strain Shintoku TaxID=869250 RepID=J4D8E0_THEOR|nr:ABC transporter [Theileria orientalis strain Shintoku]BAM40730.1 ABC transporter [Theileria orientalis strain Shintoku]|eukprot:XP_009691031.1 ABC transporter [Theileria orientalis strain Shintoku]